MSRLRIITLFAASTLLGPAEAQEKGAAFKFETQQVEPYLAERAGAVAQALRAGEWPDSSELYVAPYVSRALFRDPGSVSEEVRACTVVRFGNEPWASCTWSWKELDLQITLAPSARAAQEHLLLALSENMLPTEGMSALYRSATRREGLGPIAFELAPPKSTETKLSFVRANVAIQIRARGELREEAARVAAQLDEQLLSQQPLTLEQLRARRPQVRAGEKKGDQLTYQVNADPRDVFATLAVIDGNTVPAGGGIVRAGEKAAGDVEVLVIGRELVVGSTR